MEYEDVLNTVGLGMGTLFSTQGQLCAQEFDKVLAMFESKDVKPEARGALADNFSTWAAMIDGPTREAKLSANYQKIYTIIANLSKGGDDKKKDSEYTGSVYVAMKIAGVLNTAAMMDQTQGLCTKFTAPAYDAALAIVNSGLPVAQTSPFSSRQSEEVCRGDLIIELLRTVPYQGTINSPNGITVLSKILLDSKMPAKVKQQATSSLQTMSMINKSALAMAGKEIMALIKAGGNDQLLMLYLSLPELYSNYPDAVHENLQLFMNQPFATYCSVFYSIARLNPRALLPHLNFLKAKMSDNAMMVLMIFERMSAEDPNSFFQIMPELITKGSAVQSDLFTLAKIAGNAAKATNTKNAADSALNWLIGMLNDRSHCDATAAAVIINEILNISSKLSNRSVLSKHMAVIKTHRASADAVVAKLEDFAAGRSLESVQAQVTALEKKVTELNGKVAKTCANMADVIAYVDANMADMKDFLAEVVKKLPTPKRLEINGTVRKALVLHFECCHTGYEYAIVSYEWSKWLKVGFSLVKAGTAIIDLGVGNPLGVLKKGAECVSEIYSAYKSKDDEEFNTYITQPFLTSVEQDRLLEKLRDQGFFDKFAYDAQLHGWYLLNPEKDGTPSAGAAGSVSRNAFKGNVMETVQAAISDFGGDVVSAIGGDAASSMLDSATQVAGYASAIAGAVSGGGSGDGDGDGGQSAVSGGAGSGRTGGPGKRAAALRAQFDAGDVAASEAMVAGAESRVAAADQMADLEKRVATLEAKVRALESQGAKTQCCVIA